MDEIILKLKTPEECIRFADKYTELVQQARRRAIELRALSHNNESEVETELLKALYAYEEVLTKKNQRRTRASRTWQMINRHGIIGAAERAVNRKIEATGYKVLVEIGMQDLTFESVIVHFPEAFNHEVVTRAKMRLEELRKI
ncbi:MAG TPA: hypothetical protein PK816_05455 [Candidatus Cloacimonadota bacterium]|jgi:hypothetical protein|nr:hypothetical protein [Candidatus Cloacimonadota bacterium]